MWPLLLLLLWVQKPEQQAPIVVGPNYFFNWDQRASNDIEVKELSFIYFLDGPDVPHKLLGVQCKGKPPLYTCSAPVMKLNPGLHSISLVALNSLGKSKPSEPYRFVVIYNVRND